MPVDGSVVNNHGDRKSPKDKVFPLPNGLYKWLINRGDPNYLLTGNPSSKCPQTYLEKKGKETYLEQVYKLVCSPL